MISRRAVLKGILGGSPVFLGLPILEQMLNNNGTALAAGTALPRRYGLFFWGNGVPWSWRHRGLLPALVPRRFVALGGVVSTDGGGSRDEQGQKDGERRFAHAQDLPHGEPDTPGTGGSFRMPPGGAPGRADVLSIILQ